MFFFFKLVNERINTSNDALVFAIGLGLAFFALAALTALTARLIGAAVLRTVDLGVLVRLILGFTVRLALVLLLVGLLLVTKVPEALLAFLTGVALTLLERLRLAGFLRVALVFGGILKTKRLIIKVFKAQQLGCRFIVYRVLNAWDNLHGLTRRYGLFTVRTFLACTSLKECG